MVFIVFFRRRAIESEEEEEETTSQAIPSEELNAVVRDLSGR